MSESEDTSRLEASALRRAAEVLNGVLHDAQRRLAEEAVATVHRREPARARKPDPIPFVDLTPYEGMSDKDVLLALGAPKGTLSYYKSALQKERARLDTRLPNEAPRCEAGVVANLGLRCTRAALPGERWCRMHHPDPPVGAMSAGEEKRQRLRRDQLWQRPDGRVLEALYELADRVDDLCAVSQQALDRALRLEAFAAERSTPTWLTADEAAAYTRRKRSAVTRAAAAGELSGARSGERGSWSFKPADLDVWMEGGRYNTGRYATARSPSRSRRP